MVLGLLAVLLLAGVLFAQIEGERGINPIASTTDIEVNGIEVNVTGKTAEEARQEGWRVAQRKGWEKLGGPKMPDGQIESMVSAVVIEREQIGPRRYIATLGVIFDRARAGQYLNGGNSERAHSAPMLVLPILYSGGTAQVFEVRGIWQRAWAEFRTGASAIDYVRLSGAGGDSLVLTAGQPTRRSRLWWRTLLDQYGAADVLIPIARLERQWPGGPVKGTFTARYGPDNTFLQSFTLEAKDEAGVRPMLNQALVRLDQIYAQALFEGLLRPDPTLLPEAPVIDPALAELIARGNAAEQQAEAAGPDAAASEGADSSVAQGSANTYSIQYASPDAAAVDAALAAVRGTSGVQSATTVSLAMGGTSVMRVTYGGELSALAAALRAKGWQVSVGSNALSIKR